MLQNFPNQTKLAAGMLWEILTLASVQILLPNEESLRPADAQERWEMYLESVMYSDVLQLTQVLFSTFEGAGRRLSFTLWLELLHRCRWTCFWTPSSCVWVRTWSPAFGGVFVCLGFCGCELHRGMTHSFMPLTLSREGLGRRRVSYICMY